MTDAPITGIAAAFRTSLDASQCRGNSGCGDAAICMCVFAEDVIDALAASEADVARLKEALLYVISQTEHLHGLAHVTGAARQALENGETERAP